MKYLLKNANVYLKGEFKKASVLVENGVIADVLSSDADLDGVTVYNFTNSFYIIIAAKSTINPLLQCFLGI